MLDRVQIGPPGGHVVCNLGDVGACLGGRVPDALQQPTSTFRKLPQQARCTTPEIGYRGPFLGEVRGGWFAVSEDGLGVFSGRVRSLRSSAL